MKMLKYGQCISELMEEHQVEIETIKTDYEEQQANMEVGVQSLSKQVVLRHCCTEITA